MSPQKRFCWRRGVTERRLSMNFAALPTVLIHLKRFVYGEKVEKQAVYPVNLRVWQGGRKPCHVGYTLAAIIVHQGKLFAGHYYAVVHRNGFWFLVNDTQSWPLTELEALDQGAYILLYAESSTGSLKPRVTLSEFSRNQSEKDVPRIMVRVGIRKYKRCAFACSCSYAQKIPEATSSISQEASTHHEQTKKRLENLDTFAWN